jgi:hypothetical protein
MTQVIFRSQKYTETPEMHCSVCLYLRDDHIVGFIIARRTFELEIAHCREDCRDPDNLKGLASSLARVPHSWSGGQALAI